MEIRKRHDMSKSEVKKLFKVVEETYGKNSFPYKKGRYEICGTDKDVSLILFNSDPYFLIRDEKLIPSLKLFLDRDVRELSNRIIVDMGAIRFVTNGADIMRPGIVDAGSDISAGSFVVIGDMNHGKPLAIGIALFSGDQILEKTSGKVVNNIHYVGDKIWNIEV